MSSNQWTVERALREGRADLLKWQGMEVGSVTRRDDSNETSYRLAVNYLWRNSGFFFVDLKNENDMRDLCLFPNCSTERKYPFPAWREPHYPKVEAEQPEPDGPPRDWPAIWRQQMREHIERAPMVPREYVQEVLDAIDFHAAAKGISQIIRDARSGEVNP